MENRPPLAKAANGDPIDIPPEVAGWRVRRATGKPGRPRGVSNADTALPLEVPRNATADDLRDHCAVGRYRLDAIDAEGRLIDGISVFVEIRDERSEEERAADPPGAPLDRLLSALERQAETMRHAYEKQTDTLCRAFEAMANAFGPVKPARTFLVEEPSTAGAAASSSSATDEKTSGDSPMDAILKGVADIFTKRAEGAAPTSAA